MSHQCFAHHCTETIPDTKVFCLRHWQMLPPDTQRRIERTSIAENRKQGGPVNRHGEYYEAISSARRHIEQCERETTDTVLITGNTFPVKEELKALGGTWDAEAKGWRVPKAQRMAAQVLVGNGQSETLFEEEL